MKKQNEHKRGRPKGSGGEPQFHPQHIILHTLWDNIKPLSVKQIIKRTHLDRKTVMNCLKFFEGKNIVQTEKVGRERRRQLTPRGSKYWFYLRAHHAASLVTPIRFDLIRYGKVARQMKQYKITVNAVLQRLLEKHPDSLGDAKIFNAKIVSVAYELINEEKNKRVIVLED